MNNAGYIAGKTGKAAAQTTGSTIAGGVVAIVANRYGFDLSPTEAVIVAGFFTVVFNAIVKFSEKIGLVAALQRLVGKIGK